MAVRSALNKVAQIILEDRVRYCLTGAAQERNFETELASFRRALDLIK